MECGDLFSVAMKPSPLSEFLDLPLVLYLHIPVNRLARGINELHVPLPDPRSSSWWQGDSFVFIFKLQFSPPRICHRSRRILSMDNASICTRGLLISIVKTITSTIHYFCKRRVERGNTVIDSPDSTCVIGTRLLFDAC